LDAISPDEPGTLPLALEVGANTVLTPCGCAKPSIARMDYMKHSPDDWNNPEHRVNRACTRCGAHWFGSPLAVQFYTRKQWDEYVGASDNGT